MIRLPLSWADGLWEFRHPLDYLGTDGGGGIGSGPGMSVGAALALRDSGSSRLPVAVLGDGDFLMGVTALWTAVRNSVPLLVIVANNRSFFNDELHQERVALQRGRPPENRWIGQAIRDPDIDLATMARGQGCTGIGPVEDPRKLVRRCAKPSPRCAPARSASSTCASRPATPPAPPPPSCSARRDRVAAVPV